ncbi:MAG TPA: Rne/Rng family ribonuclease [Lacisediminihabitans sp.]|uniref:Rne/Rng family ribonuclease n=1 Tax=Lacisediminihabitans sp. TaxID=2787631 RepID=UPI002EDA22FF
MVETNSENTDNGAKNEGGKRRTRLFGGRRSGKSAETATAQETALTEAPAPVETPAAEASAPADVAAPAQAPAEPAEQKAPARRAPARRATAPKATSASDAADRDGGTVTEATDRSSEPEPAEAPAKAPARSTSRKAAHAADQPSDDATVNEESAAPEPAPVVPLRPTTSLIFQAPDIPVLPPRQNGRSGGQGQQDAGDDDTATVRRRARRRSGEEDRDGNGGGSPANTVVKVRTPRPAPELSNEPTKVRGSTRLEAKKQRRRDGRDAGRRRPVITEAEFLARREAVDRVMVVRSKFGRIQIGVLEDGVLVEHYVAKAADASLIGNVYLGRVQNVLPSMEAAFVDIGRGRNAVLYSGEVDWDAAAENSAEGKSQARRIELALKPGDKVLVQVTKDPVGHKGARLTSQVSLPGRYLVYVPNGSMNGISRKLPDTERSRLKKILKEVLPENVGVIVRTAAEGATEEQLTLDVNRLTAQWAAISETLETVQAPALLHSEPDLLVKIVRDVFNEDFHKLVIEGEDAFATISTYLGQVAPDLVDRLQTYEGTADSFDEYRITEQIEKALDRKVWLPSGGSLVIDRTEAMTVVDVNTGKFVGSGGNLEETVTKNNLEAAEEIVRQLRLRDIGGIIVVDFIDMVLESNRDLVLRRLVECLSRDRTKHQVAEVTSLGLIQMTRKKLGLGLIESFSEPCEVCAGRGIIIHHDPVTKHRQTAQPEVRRGRGGKGGNGNSGNGGDFARQAQAPAQKSAGGTHAITDDVKNALAQIAASTIAPTETAEPGPIVAEPGLIVVEEMPAAPSRAEEASVAAAEAAMAILDIPVAKVQRPPRRISTHDAEQILDSVLEALPEPKQPGQGRSRISRRASSAGTVHPPASESAPTSPIE